ncbi:MAG TPA: protein kinase [Kofleriaceae bacterium]|nr:protein kinase [Kofleriaceae bacterium]
MAGSDTNDPLANTVTAAPSATPAPSSPASVSASHGEPRADDLRGAFGRYMIERAIGNGAMGIVYRAIDPDLERAVALKVLRNDTNHEARTRLLREARAMAKVSHPNVVAVHEVGSVAGRDFIAMELVEGTTVAEWIRATPRSIDELLNVFVAAGNGLVAAHAKGVVHRDFKPHNILRSAEGHVQVTDFGLARSVDADPLAQTIDAASQTAAATTKSAPELTQTGSLLGTPAYMAPEQWHNQTVGPAADQFAWSVALWEALAGKRPFPGDTIAQLRENILAGAEKLDASAIPRRIRPVLLRGLAVEPRNRFPSMNALLHALLRARRKRSLAFIGLGAVTATAVGIAALSMNRSTEPAAAGCPEPTVAPTTLWTASVEADLRKAGKVRFADEISAELQLWNATRTNACKAEPKLRVTQLACLDGVMARTAVVVQAAGLVTARAANFEPRAELVDPNVCLNATPPQLTSSWPAVAADVFALRLRADETTTSVTVAEASEVIARAGDVACVKAQALLLRSMLQTAGLDHTRSDTDEAAEYLARCNDDRVRADVTSAQAFVVLRTPFADTQFANAVRRAEASATRIPEAVTLSAVLQLKGEAARNKGLFDEAGKLMTDAAKPLGERGLQANKLRTQLVAIDSWAKAPHKYHGQIVDAVTQGLATSEALFGPSQELTQTYKRLQIILTWQTGDIKGAKAMSEALEVAPFVDKTPSEELRGRVVNAQGKPVAGAQVVAARGLHTDGEDLSPFAPSREPNEALTDDKGQFVITKAPQRSTIEAMLGPLRSRPLEVKDGHGELILRLEPTSTIKGKVNIFGNADVSGIAALPSEATDAMQFSILAPVAADGSFSIENVPLGRVRLVPGTSDQSGLGDSVMVTLGAAPLTNVNIDINRIKRTVYVVIRGTMMVPPVGGQAIVVDAKSKFQNAGELQLALAKQATLNIASANPMVGEKIPKPLIGKVQPGELIAELQNVSAEPHRVCGLGISGDVSKREFWEKLQGNLKRVGVTCVDLGPKQDTVFIEVPPLPKFD